MGDGFSVSHGVILKEAGREERMQGESVSTKQISTPRAWLPQTMRTRDDVGINPVTAGPNEIGDGWS